MIIKGYKSHIKGPALPIVAKMKCTQKPTDVVAEARACDCSSMEVILIESQ